MAEARKRGNKRMEEKEEEKENEEEITSGSPFKALTVNHLQGPLFLLLMGLIFAIVLFAGEVLMLVMEKRKIIAW